MNINTISVVVIVRVKIWCSAIAGKKKSNSRNPKKKGLIQRFISEILCKQSITSIFHSSPARSLSMKENLQMELGVSELLPLTKFKRAMNATTTVVRNTIWLQGELIEDSFEWYAQDKPENVCYFRWDSKMVCSQCSLYIDFIVRGAALGMQLVETYDAEN